MALEKYIPIHEEKQTEQNPVDTGCEASEPFALMVMGDSMAPEFNDGEIIIIDPSGVARDESFVLAHHNGEYTFRQLRIIGERWYLTALSDQYPAEQISGPDAIKGVITQKTKPGDRKSTKKYS
jgi:SOS-response transcriptional repressor LexA